MIWCEIWRGSTISLPTHLPRYITIRVMQFKREIFHFLRIMEWNKTELTRYGVKSDMAIRFPCRLIFRDILRYNFRSAAVEIEHALFPHFLWWRKLNDFTLQINKKIVWVVKGKYTFKGIEKIQDRIILIFERFYGIQWLNLHHEHKSAHRTHVATKVWLSDRHSNTRFTKWSRKTLC